MVTNWIDDMTTSLLSTGLFSLEQTDSSKSESDTTLSTEQFPETFYEFFEFEAV